MKRYQMEVSAAIEVLDGWLACTEYAHNLYFVAALAGTYKEMVWGLMLGFFLGLICLFWFRESVFTRRHQMGKIECQTLSDSSMVFKSAFSFR